MNERGDGCEGRDSTDSQSVIIRITTCDFGRQSYAGDPPTRVSLTNGGRGHRLPGFQRGMRTDIFKDVTARQKRVLWLLLGFQGGFMEHRWISGLPPLGLPHERLRHLRRGRPRPGALSRGRRDGPHRPSLLPRPGPSLRAGWSTAGSSSSKSRDWELGVIVLAALNLSHLPGRILGMAWDIR